MNDITPIYQTKLFGLDKFLAELIQLYHKNNLPNKILLSGQKGLGKSTLALHFINYILSTDEEFSYDIDNHEINIENRSFRTIINKSNPNLIIVDVNPEKKMVEISQIRELIINLNKSSFNKKPRFVLIDNIEFLNVNSVNALLKVLEEPNQNIHFILINNNKKILKTLLSRCINLKISLTNEESINIADKLLDGKLDLIINKDLINYYSTPGVIYNLANFGKINDYDLIKIDLKKFLKILIKENHYRKDKLIKNIIFDLIEFYFIKINLSFSSVIYDKYSYFLKRISDTKRFNLDDETLFIEFEDEILDG